MKYGSKLICFFLLFLYNSVNAADYYTVMKTDKLPIRSGPGENYPIVGSLSLGDTVLIDSIISPWCQIKDGNKIEGYANGWYLSKVDSSVNSDKSDNNKISYEWIWWIVAGVLLLTLFIIANKKNQENSQTKETENRYAVYGKDDIQSLISAEKTPDQINEKKINCPRCGSTQISIDKKGYSATKGCCGYFACGPLGFLFGQSGANKTRKTCLNCNNTW